MASVVLNSELECFKKLCDNNFNPCSNFSAVSKQSSMADRFRWDFRRIFCNSNIPNWFQRFTDLMETRKQTEAHKASVLKLKI